MYRKMAVLFAVLISPAMFCAEALPKEGDVIAIHILSSHRVGQDKINNGMDELLVRFAGRKYYIESSHGDAVLRLGDYQAKVVHYESPHAYEYKMKVEIIFPDGKSRTYWVTGEEE